MNFQKLGEIFTLCFLVLLDQLRCNNVLTQGFRYAKNSARNVLSHIRTFLFFCRFYGLSALPASATTLMYFSELMALTVSYAHIKNLLSSVKFLHEAYNLKYPSNNFNLDTTLQGLKRKLAKTPNQVLPINPTILREIYVHLNMEKRQDLALWCSFLVAFFCLFRKKNVVPESDKPDTEKTLRRKHIEVDLENNVVLIYCNFSKTNQFGASDLVIPVPGNEDPMLDLVKHLSKLFNIVQPDADAPAFSYGQNKFISYKLFTDRLKSLLALSGYNPALYSGHSFRRGGASFLYQVGGSILQIMSSGDWSSSCFTRYLFLTEEERLDAQLLMSKALSSNKY